MYNLSSASFESGLRPLNNNIEKHKELLMEKSREIRDFEEESKSMNKIIEKKINTFKRERSLLIREWESMCKQRKEREDFFLSSVKGPHTTEIKHILKLMFDNESFIPLPQDKFEIKTTELWCYRILNSDKRPIFAYITYIQATTVLIATLTLLLFKISTLQSYCTSPIDNGWLLLAPFLYFRVNDLFGLSEFIALWLRDPHRMELTSPLMVSFTPLMPWVLWMIGGCYTYPSETSFKHKIQHLEFKYIQGLFLSIIFIMLMVKYHIAWESILYSFYLFSNLILGGISLMNVDQLSKIKLDRTKRRISCYHPSGNLDDNIERSPRSILRIKIQDVSLLTPELDCAISDALQNMDFTEILQKSDNTALTEVLISQV